MTRLLLVEDEERLAASLVTGLATAQIDVTAVGTGREGLEHALKGDFDIMLLDIGLPDQEGFTVLRKIRASGSDLPVIILTARPAPRTPSAGSSAARTTTWQSRSPSTSSSRAFGCASAATPQPTRPPQCSRPGNCVLDPIARTLELDGEPVSLSNREFQLAQLLMSRAGDVVTRAEAMEHVWGSAAHENVLDVYIGYLRSRLGADAIETVRGKGYRFRG